MITAALVAAALVLCAFISTPTAAATAGMAIHAESTIAHADSAAVYVDGTIAHAGGIAVHADGANAYASDEAAGPDDPGTCIIHGVDEVLFSFNEALSAVRESETITMLTDIRVGTLTLSQGFWFTIDLYHHNLTVDGVMTVNGDTMPVIYSNYGSVLTAGSVVGNELSNNSSYTLPAPIICNGANIFVTGGITAGCSAGTRECCGIFTFSGSVTVGGDVVVTGSWCRGVWVEGATSVYIDGDVIVEGVNSVGVSLNAYGGSTVSVKGNIRAVGNYSIGINGFVGSAITVNGDVSAEGDGIMVNIGTGTFTAGIGGDVASVFGNGVNLFGNAQVTVDGNVNGLYKARLNGTLADMPDASSDKPGYERYSNTSAIVWVGDSSSFTVTYNANGGGGAPAGAGIYKQGVIVTVSHVAPSRSNYTFAGWRYDNNTYYGGNSFVMPGNDVVLTAQWTGNAPSGPPGGGGPSGPANPVNPSNPENPGGGEGSDVTEDIGDSDIPETGGSARLPGAAERSAGNRQPSNRSAINPSVPTKPSDNLPPGTPIFTDDHIRYIIGYPEGDIKPENNITRAEAVTAFYRLLSEEMRYMPASDWKQFSDVELGSWYYMPVSIMIVEEIILGYDDGTFRPDANISRAELAAIASRFAALMGHGGGGASSFSDVTGHWAEADIIRLADFGWSVGYNDGTFRPDQPITRAEFMAIVNRMLKRVPETADDILAGEMEVWRDNIDPGAWYYLVVQEATNSHTYEYKGVPVPNAGFEYERWIALM